MVDANDPVRRLLERIDHAGTPAGWPSGVITPDVARTWLALPEQLQQARDAMRWQKASRDLPDGIYATAVVGHDGVDVAMVAGGRVYEGVEASISIDDVSKHARFLGPLPEVPR